MTFRANKNGTWVGGDDQSAGTTVYGKLGGSWLYAKEVFAKKDGVWSRAWTDCRKYDEAGGRDWSSSSQVFTDATGCDSCGTKSKTVVTYTKTGCPNDVRDPGYGVCSDEWVAATASQIDTGGVTYYNTSPGNYFTFGDPCTTCGVCQLSSGDYYITTCASTGAYRITQVGCGCVTIC
jgi:hypothetical protein